MTIKNILVAYTGSKSSHRALNVAMLMARKYDAHLTGVITHGLPTALYSYGSHLPQTAMHQLEEADREHRAIVRKSFHTATIDLNSETTHFLDVFGEADEKLMEVARTYDLVIMGMSDEDSEFQHMEVHPDVVARKSGRPVLVVPSTYEAETLGDTALLAWDGRRAAARAMADAMQIFESKRCVSVLTVGETEDATKTALPIITQLERHNIPCKTIVKERKKRGIAQCILETVEEESAGILVMGAYEHSKIAEDLFGGVTNTVLEKSKIPVFLSH